jgi:hypothetical protein
MVVDHDHVMAALAQGLGHGLTGDPETHHQ